jgi:hypothetical protein
MIVTAMVIAAAARVIPEARLRNVSGMSMGGGDTTLARSMDRNERTV